MATSASDLLDQLSRSLDAVGVVIEEIGPHQWTAPTPCTDWSVSRVVGHVMGMNRVFTAMLADQPPPLRESISDDAVEQALAFAQTQLTDDARPGRFAPVQLVSAGASAIDRLAAFLGRRPDWRSTGALRPR